MQNETTGETFTPFDVTETRASSAECDWCDEGSDLDYSHHHEIYETREGASHRTADELADIFLDAVEAYAAPWKREEYVPRNVSGWCEDVDDSQALSDAIRDGESALADAGLYVSWDDGYAIERVVDDSADGES